jgi:hypothetical protein
MSTPKGVEDTFSKASTVFLNPDCAIEIYYDNENAALRQAQE